MKSTLLMIIACLQAMAATSQSCLPNGILFSNQAAIDNFQINYPQCTEIGGNVRINGSDISNLSGLSVLTSIGNSLIIGDISQSGLNPNLTSLTGLDNLVSIGGDFIIRDNDYLTDISGLSDLYILNGRLIIMNNNSLTTLDGLENVIADSITGLMIRNNYSLSDCQLYSICSYLSNPGGVV